MLLNSVVTKGLGPDSASIMVVSEYPTKEECIHEVSLSGKAGGLIDRLLQQGGSRLNNVYRTTYIKRPCPELEGYLNKKNKEKAIESLLALDFYKEILIKEIEAIKPNVIVALGELSLRFLAHEKSIYSFRGSILPPSPLLKLNFHPKIIPTLHPRDIWANYESLAYVNVDFQRIVKTSSYPNHIPYKRDEIIWIARTYKEFYNWWYDRGRFGEFLVFDIETYLNYITCIGFCHNGKEAVSVKLWDYSAVQEQRMLWRLLQEVFKHPIPKTNQNIGFDRYFINKWGFVVNNVQDDTMLLGHTVYPELPKNLGFYTSIYTDQPYYKDEGKEFNPKFHSFDQLQYYNAKDALVTWQIIKAQKQDAEELGVLKFYQGFDYDYTRLTTSTDLSTITIPDRGIRGDDNNGLHLQTTENCQQKSNDVPEAAQKIVKLGVMPLFHIYQKINERGIRIDEEARWKLWHKYQTLAEMHVCNLRRAYGKDLNVRSPDQVGRFVYEFLGIPAITHKTDSGKTAYDTDKETIEDLYINKDLKDGVKTALREIIVTRKIFTILNYICATTHQDGRLRTTYRLEGTKSGRTSGSSHYDREYFVTDKGELDYIDLGCSLQTLPKRSYEVEEFEGETYGSDIPNMFVPSPGYVFLEGDGKAAEAGVVCILAKDYDTLHYMYFRQSTKKNKYGCKDDIHVLTAEWCTGKSFDYITKYERENYGKRPRHAGNYDQTKHGLSRWIHKPQSQCADILDRFHRNAPQIRGIFHQEVRNHINATGTLRSPQGRRRDFFGRRNDSLYREAYSYIPQACISDHTKFSILILNEIMPEALCLVEKHDGLLFEVPSEKAEAFGKLFQRVYERKIDFRDCTLSREFELVIPAEVSISKDNWGSMEEMHLNV